MKFAGSNSLKWLCLMACAAMTAAAPAFASIDSVLTDDNPYTIISQRNVFRLSPPPPPPAPEAEKPADLPKVILSGFVESGHVMRVLLVKQVKEATNPPTYLSLKAGERKDNVEIVRIRYEKGEVDIINSGTPMTLSAANNSYAGSGLALKGTGDARASSRIGGISTSHGFRAMPSMPGSMAPTTAMPEAPSVFPTATGSSAIIMGGGAGFGAPGTPGASSTNPRFPGDGLPNSGVGTGIPGNSPSAAAAFVSGPGAGSSAPANSAGDLTTSMSDAQMRNYLAAKAHQNQTSPVPPLPPQDQ